MKYDLAVVIGKFYPPHRGHKLLIDTAAAQSRKTVVIVCERPTDSILGELRRQWLAEIHPAARVILIDDRYDEDDSRIWAENTIRWLGRSPDAVFTSEDYGDRYAAHMGAKHILVDRQRLQVPISATLIREDPYLYWEHLEPPVRAWFAKRVCVLGAESTGTTTLAQALAEHLSTSWVAEYGRQYSARKMAADDFTWSSEEFVTIAQEQTRQEELAARRANRVLICDTNAFATMLWHRRYMDANHPQVEKLAYQSRCDLYLLTGDEIPFVQDGLRDGEPIRHAMHSWFEEALKKQPVSWGLLRGSHDKRLAEAMQLILELFSKSKWSPKALI